MKKRYLTSIMAIIMALMLAACSTEANTSDSSAGSSTDKKTGTTTSTAVSSVTGTNAVLTLDNDSADTEELFTKRDLNQTPDLDEAEYITVESGKIYTISESGTYVFSGTATNTTIKVEADKEDKVQLVLEGLSITNDDFPAIYVVSADKCFRTTSGSNSLKATGSFSADGDTNTDAVIYS